MDLPVRESVTAKIQAAVFWEDAPMTHSSLSALLLRTLDEHDLWEIREASLNHGKEATKNWLRETLHSSGVPLGLLVTFL